MSHKNWPTSQRASASTVLFARDYSIIAHHWKRLGKNSGRRSPGIEAEGSTIVYYSDSLWVCVMWWHHTQTLIIFLYISSSVCMLCHSCTWWGLFRSKPLSCSMKFEHLHFSVNLVWHDLKLQYGSSHLVRIKEPFRLNVICPPRFPSSSNVSLSCKVSSNL